MLSTCIQYAAKDLNTMHMSYCRISSSWSKTSETFPHIRPQVHNQI